LHPPARFYDIQVIVAAPIGFQMRSSQNHLKTLALPGILLPFFLAVGHGVQAGDHACDSYGGCLTCDSVGTSCCETPIEQYRDSFFQGAEILGGYLGDLGDAEGGMDQSYQEVRASFGIPLGDMDNILGFRPYFRVDNLSGPTSLDLPETLYDTGLTMLHEKTWTGPISSTLILSPGVRSDFKTGDNAFRIFGLAVINWEATCDLTLSLGVVYFDRDDVPLLPAFGASWTPTPQWKIDATMPRPRIARRLWKNCDQAEGWAYIAGVMGGSTWAVKRDSGLSDDLSIRDFRALFGYEVVRPGNRGFFVEGGYVFGRTIEYESQIGDLDLDDALIVAAGWKF
jgi:hypothetical protein